MDVRVDSRVKLAVIKKYKSRDWKELFDLGLTVVRHITIKLNFSAPSRHPIISSFRPRAILAVFLHKTGGEWKILLGSQFQ